MAVQVWRCRRVQKGVKCDTLNLRTKQKCTTCGAPRPKRKQPAHRAVLNDLPYEWWAERYGEACNICGATAKTRRLHRDHDHSTGEARGLLCFPCNTALPNRIDPEWLSAAAEYLERGGAPSRAPRKDQPMNQRGV